MYDLPDQDPLIADQAIFQERETAGADRLSNVMHLTFPFTCMLVLS